MAAFLFFRIGIYLNDRKIIETKIKRAQVTHLDYMNIFEIIFFSGLPISLYMDFLFYV